MDTLCPFVRKPRDLEPVTLTVPLRLRKLVFIRDIVAQVAATRSLDGKVKMPKRILNVFHSPVVWINAFVYSWLLVSRGDCLLPARRNLNIKILSPARNVMLQKCRGHFVL